MKAVLLAVVTVVAIFFINLIIYKIADIFSWHFLPKKPSGISKRQYSYFLFGKKNFDSDEFTDAMENIWKNTDLAVFRKLLDI